MIGSASAQVSMSENGEPERHAPWWTLVIPLLVSLALGFYGLSVPESHVDFGTIQGVFPPSWLDFTMDFLTPSGIYGGVYPPAYFVLVKAYGSVVGTDLVSIRILSVLAFAGLVVVSWHGLPLLTKHPSPMLRFWFALSVATSPAHVWWAQTARYTIWLYLFYAVAMLASLKFLSEPGKRSARFLILAFLLLFCTHYVSFFFIAASFAVMGSVALWTHHYQLLRTLARYGAVAVLVTLPILPSVVFSTLSQRGGYHTQYDEKMTPASLLRATVMDWNFGNSLLPRGGGFLVFRRSIASIRCGSTLEIAALRYVSPAIVATILLSAALGYAGVRAGGDREAREKACYVTSVVVLTLLLSAMKGLANRFVYFGFGTWCTLAFLVIGWGAQRSLKLPFLLGGGMLALNSLSLVNYYSNLELKYPGMGVIAKDVGSHAYGASLLIVDRWIVETRNSPLERDRMPPGVQVTVADSEVVLRMVENQGVALAFLAGTREELERELRSQERETNVSWAYIRSFDSMESRERSIHLYRFDEHTPP
jgi:hypothetical protein